MELGPEQVKQIRNLLVSLEGKDPELEQITARFMNVDNPIERTNLPTRRDVHFMSYLDFVGKVYFPDLENGFTKLGDSVSTCFMAFKGLKSQQVVDLLRNQPDLTGFQIGPQAEESRGFMDKLLGRGPKE